MRCYKSTPEPLIIGHALPMNTSTFAGTVAMQAAAAGTMTTKESQSWSGYQNHNESSDKWCGAQGDFTVPTNSTISTYPTAQAAFWIGLGDDFKLSQAGIVMSGTQTNPVYKDFIECFDGQHDMLTYFQNQH